MAMTVVGASISHGIWKPDGKEIPYNNVIIHYVEDLSIRKDDNGNVVSWGIGRASKTLKIKNDADILRSIFGSPFDDVFAKSLIGKTINVYYDMYRKPARVEIVKA